MKDKHKYASMNRVESPDNFSACCLVKAFLHIMCACAKNWMDKYSGANITQHTTEVKETQMSQAAMANAHKLRFLLWIPESSG